MVRAMAEMGQVPPSEVRKMSRMPCGKYLARWLEDSVRPHVARSTYSTYEAQVRLYMLPALGHVPLMDLTPAHIRAMASAMLKRGLSPITVTNTLGTLSVALGQAVEDGIIAANPAARVRRPKYRREEIMALSEEEVGRFLAASRGEREYAMYEMAVKTGMRFGELRALRFQDIDFESREIHVRRAVTVRHGEEHWGPPKNGRARTIVFGDNLAGTLQAHRRRLAEEKLAAGPAWEDRDLVFPGRRGQVMPATTLHTRFRKALRRAGIDRKIRFHTLRHTAATLMLRSGVDVRTVAEILGHTDPAMTLRTYSHVLSSMQLAAASKMDALAPNWLQENH
ncbi:MAG: site-specific integrase [Rubrobacteraceae bacterium]|nr:site-specific integrase [Rubrobacteraceae bacterium]